MAITRINNNQITDASTGNVYVCVNAAAKVQDYSVTAGKIANNLVYGSDLTVSGNLTVNGNTTTIDTVNLVVEDPLILLAKEQTGSPTLDIGFIGQRGTSNNIAFVWDEGSSQFVTVYTDTLVSNTTVNILGYANLQTDYLTASGLSVTGNIAIGNISVTGNVIGDLNISGNATASNFLTTGVISATGNVTGGNVNTSGLVTATGNVTGANINTIGLVSATGNVNSGNVNTGIVLATGNVTGANVSTTGLITATGNITSGANVVATGNVIGGNISTTGLITATGNVDAGNVNTGIVSATGNVNSGNVNTGIVSATGNVDAGNVNTGIVSATGNVAAAGFTGGNASLTGNVYAANFIGNISGNIDAGGSNTQVQFNDEDVLNGSANFTFDKSTNTMTVTGTMQGTTVSATGNVIGGNISTTGLVTATGNVTGGNITSNGVADITGNITGGNLLTGGIVSSTGNVIGGNITTTGLVTATGNVNSGNVNTGIVSATGNVIGGNISTTGLVTATGNVNSGNVNTGIVSATGNVDSGNVNTGIVSASGNIIGPTVVTSTVTTGSGDLVLNSAGGALQWDGSGNIVMNSQWINNLADPTQAYDAATKQYVDDAVSSGIHIHTPVDVEAPVALPSATYNQGGTTATVTDTIAGNTVVFSSAVNPQPNDQLWFTNSFNGVVANVAYFVVSAPNTSAAVLSTQYNGSPVSNITNGSSLTEAVRINSGFGANLVATANAALVVDGYSVSSGNRVLVYNQSNAYENGVYDVTDAGNVSAPWILTRSTDANSYIPDTSTGLDEGSYFYVKYGSTGAGESYVMTAPIGPFNIGQAAITFTQFSASQVYTANTAAGIVLNGTVFSAKVDNDTTAFDSGGNIIVKAGANLVTPNIGAATGTSLSLTGNVDSGNVNTAIVSATGNVTGGNISTAGLVTATGNVIGGNISTTGNVDSGNVNTGIVSATGNVDAGNVNTGIVSATGNVAAAGFTGGNASLTGNVYAANFIGNISGNIDAGGSNTQVQFNDEDVLNGSANFTFDKATNIMSVTGNVNSGNVNTGIVSATGNVTGANISTTGLVTSTGNVTGGNLVTGGLVTATGNITSGANVVATGNVIGGNISTTGLVTATGNVTGGNLVTGGLVTATGNVNSGNVNTGIVSATGNVIGGNVSTAGNVDANNVNATTSGKFGNIVISGDDITDVGGGIVTINGAGADVDFAVNGDTTPNVFYVDAGTGTASFGSDTQTTNAIVAFNTSNSILIPVGNTLQRPGTGVTGMIRFNTSIDSLEYYDNDSWTSAGTTFTIVTADSFIGTGACTTFTLSDDSTTAATIVSINGVVQIPTTAYSVTGNSLQFTEAPAVDDKIDARLLVTTTTVTGIQNSSGNAVFEGSPTSSAFTIQGNLIPSANVTYDLGSSSLRFRDGYFSGNSITLGNIVMKNTSGNSVGFFGPDGSTPATLDANVEVVGDTIQNGTSAVQFSGLNGNVVLTAGGANTGIITSTGANIAGYVNATGNITGSYIFGNGSQLTGIDATSIQSGTSSVTVIASGGNVRTNIGGATVSTVYSGGVLVTGLVSASGNVTSSNLNLSGDIFDTGALTINTASNGNITLSPNGTGAIIANKDILNGQANGVGNIGNATGYFNTIFAKATSAQYADLAEMYEADRIIEPGTVVCFGGAKEVTVCGEDGSRRVAGVVSTNPSYIMNAGLNGENVVAVALTGRVPTKVTGIVRKGDMMVATTDGRARAESNPAVGAVIGKALADFDGAEGVIEVVIGRL